MKPPADLILPTQQSWMLLPLTPENKHASFIESNDFNLLFDLSNCITSLPLFNFDRLISIKLSLYLHIKPPIWSSPPTFSPL